MEEIYFTVAYSNIVQSKNGNYSVQEIYFTSLSCIQTFFSKSQDMRIKMDLTISIFYKSHY